MTTRFSVSLILPANNEVKRIAQTVTEAKPFLDQLQQTYEIIISADGDDGTRGLAAAMAKTDPTLKVIGSPERHGKGYGIRQGVALARGGRARSLSDRISCWTTPGTCRRGAPDATLGI